MLAMQLSARRTAGMCPWSRGAAELRGIAKSYCVKLTGVECCTEWTDETCMQLVMHAMDLGHNGNPAGFLLVSSLHQFIGYDIDAYWRQAW